MAKLAMGFLEVAGYGTALYAIDKMCKTVDINIMGIDTINPKNSSAKIPLTVQVKFSGKLSEVKLATEIGREAALKFNDNTEIVTSVIGNPYKNIDKL